MLSIVKESAVSSNTGGVRVSGDAAVNVFAFAANPVNTAPDVIKADEFSVTEVVLSTVKVSVEPSERVSGVEAVNIFAFPAIDVVLVAIAAVAAWSSVFTILDTVKVVESRFSTFNFFTLGLFVTFLDTNVSVLNNVLLIIYYM